jgi:hypothetical protein
MKKILLAVLGLSVFTSVSRAQSSSDGFAKGDNVVNLGIGLGTPFFSGGYSSSLPINPTISFEHGIGNAISVGAELSYATAKDSYYGIKYSATYVGARGSYHFGDALQLDKKIDLYGGVGLGYVIVSVSDNTDHLAATGSAAGYGLYAGGKYYFAPSTAVYAELGYQSLSYLNIGIAFKF